MTVQIVLLAALACAHSVGAAPEVQPGASPRAYPTFVVPTEPEEVPTVSSARVAGGAVGGLLLGFALGEAAGIAYYNYNRRREPGLPTLTEGALKQGARIGAAGGALFALLIAAYAAYATPPRSAAETSPGTGAAPLDGATAGGALDLAPPPGDPLALALAAAESALSGKPVPWATGVELDGERLAVRVTDGYDSIAPAEREKVCVRLLSAYNAVLREHGRSDSADLWIKGPTFVLLWSPR